MSIEIKIIGLNISDARPWENGDRLLAHFDVEVNGFQIRGCQLIRTARRGFIARPPRIEGPHGEKGCIKIIDEQLRGQLCDVVRRKYVAFGGQHGDWDRSSANGA